MTLISFRKHNQKEIETYQRKVINFIMVYIMSCADENGIKKTNFCPIWYQVTNLLCFLLLKTLGKGI